MFENDTDRSEGPRLAVLGCREGNLALVRHDVARPQELMDIIAAQPPWVDADTLPPWTEALIGRLAPIRESPTSMLFALPNRLGQPEPDIACSDDSSGRRLLASLERDGVPPHLAEAGFATVSDFWAPWCAVMDKGQVAALAFAARLAADAAEVGVYTFPQWRRRGFAARAVSAWAGLPVLANRSLFYSTLATNTASRAVAARLRLKHIGAGLRIS